jgi:RNA polymerase sigma factor (sigma-70 family)
VPTATTTAAPSIATPAATDQIALLARAAGGDQQAWTVILDTYGGLVAGVARSMRLSEADIADVSQATWLALLEHAGRIREPGRLASWLVTVTRREALRLLRQSARQVPVSDHDYLDRLGAPTGPADGTVLLADQHLRLRRAIQGLPERAQRLVRMLLTHPDASYAELAAYVRIPLGSVGPTRARCIESLRATLA